MSVLGNGVIKDLTDYPIAPGTTPSYTGVVQDQFGNAIPGAALTSLVLSVVDTVTGADISPAVHDQNILNTGRGTVDSLGNLSVTLLTTDTALQNAAHSKEFRSLILTWTWNGGSSVGKREVRLLIDALAGS